MTQRSRYFLVASTVVLTVALGGGLVAYLAYQGASGVAAGVPPELRYVPGDAAVVSYIDVRGVMSSELHRELRPTIEAGSFTERQLMTDGIDLEKEVDHIVSYVEADPIPAADKPPQAGRA